MDAGTQLESRPVKPPSLLHQYIGDYTLSAPAYSATLWGVYVHLVTNTCVAALQVRHGLLPAQGVRWLEDGYLGQGLLRVGAQRARCEVTRGCSTAKCMSVNCATRVCSRSAARVLLRSWCLSTASSTCVAALSGCVHSVHLCAPADPVLLCYKCLWCSCRVSSGECRCFCQA